MIKLQPKYIASRVRFIAGLVSVALLLAVFPQSQHSQSTAEQGLVEKGSSKADLHQALLDLTNPWTVMCVAAHPDDEDGSTLTVLRRKYGVHTVSLFSTYGEGGQNAVGPELYEDLGVIRARETIAAAAIQGSEPYFLGLKDFGFSKSDEETFRAWGRTEALRRMVFQLRKLRPDAIITNHDTTRGHGHHQATGQLILEAFDAAADPSRFPEQLNQVKTWQAQRLFVRGGRAPDAQPTTSQQITIDPNEMDPMRGMTYAQQALLGLQQHATQGPWPKSISATGGRVARYTLVKSAAGAAPLPNEPKTPVDGLQLPEAIRARFTAPTIDEKPLTGFAGNHTEVLVALMNAKRRRAFTAPKDVLQIDPERFQLMASRLDTALAKATGVSVTIKPPADVLVPDERSELEVSLENTGDEELAVKRWSSSGLPVMYQLGGVKRPDKLLPGTGTFQELIVTPPKQTPISVPSSEHLYDGQLFGSQLTVEAEMEIEGVTFLVRNERRIDVAPAVEIINNGPLPCVETPATVMSCASTSLTLRNHVNRRFDGTLEVGSVKDSTPQLRRKFSLDKKATEKIVTEPIARKGETEAKIDRVRGFDLKAAVINDSSKAVVTQLIIPAWYVPAVAVSQIKVGYVPSFDTSLKNSLAFLGVSSKELAPNDVATQDLSSFDTLIIDNRGYEAHPELIQSNDKLLKFVENGGTLIVFYHKTNEWNPDERRNRPQLAPYPIMLNDERVTEENAPITFLQPQHPLMNFPNRITQQDFVNWIQERGLYYPREWDQQYTALFATHDTNEPPLKGGLLVAKYGKGNYIYTSMVWYRQLRAGIPGGYRFFANMISYGKSPAGSASRGR
ncbi:MAG TPA: PIG-L family deacetylase [Pyrinomonadaceae bacterium]